MKKLLVRRSFYVVGLLVGLVLSNSQFSYAVSRNVRDITPYVKQSVLKACDTVYEAHPEFKDQLSSSLSIPEYNQCPSVLEIAKPYSIMRIGDFNRIEVTEDGRSLYTDEYIKAMNTSLKVIREARKNRPPQGSLWLEAADAILSEFSHDPKMTHGEEKIYKKMERGNKENRRNLLAATYQANPNKISSATDEGLQTCRNAMIDTNYKLNPTWESWAYTCGMNGILQPSVSTAAMLAGLVLCANAGKFTADAVSTGAALTVLGGVGLGLSFDTNNIQFEVVVK